MTWLYIPPNCTSSASALAAEDLISASSWQFQALAQSAWWRGKASPSRIWSQRWKRVSWLRRLCGAMPEPSTAALGVAAWTASLVAFRASLIPSPESASAKMTSATSGQTPDASSSSPARGSSLSKTSAGCSPRRTPRSIRVQSVSGETYSDWVSRLRADCSRRRKSARRMSASVSSSWPSPRTSDTQGPGERGEGGPDLRTSVTSWPTPDHQVINDGEEPETFLARQEREKAKGRNGNGTGLPLAMAAKMRGTPTSRDWKDGDTTNANVPENGLLGRMAVNWSTPRSTDGEKGGPNQSFGAGGVPLAAQAQQWATPRSEMARALGNPKHITAGRGNGNIEDQTSAFSLPDRPISTVGEASSHIRRTLNPRFVEWLMAWPPGWTSLGLTPPASSVFACSETALSSFKRRMRFALSQLGSPPEAPAQLGLFG